MSVSSQVSVVLGAVHGNRGVLLRSTCVRIPDSPWPSRNGVTRLFGEGGGKTVDVLHERCAGLDISKKDAKACVRTPSTKRRGSFTAETTTWGSATNAVLDLRDHLLAARVTPVVIEATSDCWKPSTTCWPRA